MVVFGLRWLNSDKVIVFLQKVVVFGKSGCIRAKVVVLGQKRLYSCKMVVIGQR